MSKIDWAEAAHLPPKDLACALEDDRDDVDDNPEMTDAELAGMTRVRAPGALSGKVLITLRLEPDVVAAFKATGPGWQARINDTLRKGAPKVTRP